MAHSSSSNVVILLLSALIFKDYIYRKKCFWIIGRWLSVLCVSLKHYAFSCFTGLVIQIAMFCFHVIANVKLQKCSSNVLFIIASLIWPEIVTERDIVKFPFCILYFWGYFRQWLILCKWLDWVKCLTHCFLQFERTFLGRGWKTGSL